MQDDPEIVAASRDSMEKSPSSNYSWSPIDTSSINVSPINGTTDRELLHEEPSLKVSDIEMKGRVLSKAVDDVAKKVYPPADENMSSLPALDGIDNNSPYMQISPIQFQPNTSQQAVPSGTINQIEHAQLDEQAPTKKIATPTPVNGSKFESKAISGSFQSH